MAKVYLTSFGNNLGRPDRYHALLSVDELPNPVRIAPDTWSFESQADEKMLEQLAALAETQEVVKAIIHLVAALLKIQPTSIDDRLRARQAGAARPKRDRSRHTP